MGLIGLAFTDSDSFSCGLFLVDDGFEGVETAFPSAISASTLQRGSLDEM